MDAKVQRSVVCPFLLEMPCNASVVVDVISNVHVECGNHFSNRTILTAGTNLAINRAKPTTVLVYL